MEDPAGVMEYGVGVMEDGAWARNSHSSGWAFSFEPLTTSRRSIAPRFFRQLR